MAQQTQPTTELAFFPNLDQSQLSHLKNFWLGLDEVLLTSTPAEKPTVNERVRKLVQGDDRERLSKELWEWIMMDDPDKMVLKYIRAKKFNSTTDSLELLINALKFRAERKLSTIYHENPSILKQLKTAKAFIFGFDRSGSPIFRVNPRKHKAADQSPRELEDFILYSMEVTRLFVLPPAETVTMLVDMSGFGMSNMDWKCTSFMISTLESYYPETLNHQIIHNAPWIFQGLWKAISTMVDPVVRSKVLFTSKNEDLLKLVDKQNLFKTEEGESEFEWTIPENYPPVPPATSPKPDAVQAEKEDQVDRKRHLDLSPEQQQTLLKELETRATLAAHFLSLTRLWLAASQNPSSPEKVLKILALRDLMKVILRAQYLKLIPLIKPKTIYHYRGILDNGAPGTVNFEAERGQAADAAGPTSVWKGQESARPSLLKTIEQTISSFRSSYLASQPPPPQDAPTDPPAALEDPIERIFSEIIQLDY